MVTADGPAASNWPARVAHAEALERGWSRWATHRKAVLHRWRALQLLMLITAALLGSIAATSSLRGTGAAKALGFLAAAVLVGTSIIQAKILTSDAVAGWVEGRRCAESLKAAVAVAKVAAAPYDQPDAGDRLQRLTERLAGQGHGPAAFAADMTASDDDTSAPSTLSGTEYLHTRTRSQRHWHEAGAQAGHRRARWLRVIEIVVSVTAAGAAAASGFVGRVDLAQTVGTFTTIGAAVAAHLAAGQHAETATRYTATARRLGEIERRFDGLGSLLDGRSPEAHAARQVLVDETEAVLASQNGGWARDLGAAWPT